MNTDNKRLTMILAGVMATVFVLVLFTGVFSRGSNNDSKDNGGLHTETVVTEVNNTGATVNPTLPAEDKNTLTLSFIGDCIIGSESGIASGENFSAMAESNPHDYFFSKVYDVLSKDDFTVANVECVLTDRDPEKAYKDYDPAFWFKAPASHADILKLGSVEVASLVNNHVYDYGDEGFADTVEALSAQDIMVSRTLSPVYMEKNGIKIGLVSGHLWSGYQVSAIEEVLEEMQDKCDYKIVMFHGGTEKVHEPDNYKIDACRYLAESGLCDLIVGSHPHVLQPMEIVNGVPILYSLGNFCYSASNYPENKTVIFQVNLKKNQDKIVADTNLIPCYVYTDYINNYQPAVMPEGKDRDEVLAMMAKPVEYIAETQPKTTEAPTTAPVVQAPVYEETEPDVAVTEDSETYPRFEY